MLCKWGREFAKTRVDPEGVGGALLVEKEQQRRTPVRDRILQLGREGVVNPCDLLAGTRREGYLATPCRHRPRHRCDDAGQSAARLRRALPASYTYPNRGQVPPDAIDVAAMTEVMTT